jgi:uncharacterized protein involved in copper resistance
MPACAKPMKSMQSSAARGGNTAGVRQQAPIEFALVKSVLISLLVLCGLLLQSVAWALPHQRAQQAERLAHAVAHATDHGHHQHEGLGHDLDESLRMDGEQQDSDHGPHHTHASEGAQCQGLPLAALLPACPWPSGAPRAWAEAQPPSAELAGWLRPPRAIA